MSFDPPKELDDRALEQWHTLLPYIQSKGMDKPEFIEVYATLCQAVQTKYAQLQAIKELGEYIESKRDGYIRNPCYMTLNQAIDTILKISKLFGLSPADQKALANVEEETSEGAPSYMAALQRK